MQIDLRLQDKILSFANDSPQEWVVSDNDDYVLHIDIPPDERRNAMFATFVVDGKGIDCTIDQDGYVLDKYGNRKVPVLALNCPVMTVGVTSDNYASVWLEIPVRMSIKRLYDEEVVQPDDPLMAQILRLVNDTLWPEQAAERAEAAAETAISAKQAAETIEENALSSKTAAEQSAQNAAQSEVNAAASEANAAESETNAAESAQAASVSESNAAISETNAAGSEANAAQSEANAAASERAAKQSEKIAAQIVADSGYVDVGLVNEHVVFTITNLDDDEESGTSFTTDETLILENHVLRVNTTNNVEQDNTLPITAAGVYTQVGNIEALLQTI